MHFLRTCMSFTKADVHLLDECLEAARDITRRTFLKHVDRDSLRALEKQLGYARHPKQGLTAASDWAVSYSKSFFNGKVCVFMRWSAIEHIFVDP